MVTIQGENNPLIILNLGGSILPITLLSVLLLTAYVTVQSGFAISIFAQEQNSNLSSSDSVKRLETIALQKHTHCIQ